MLWVWPRFAKACSGIHSLQVFLGANSMDFAIVEIKTCFIFGCCLCLQKSIRSAKLGWLGKKFSSFENLKSRKKLINPNMKIDLRMAEMLELYTRKKKGKYHTFICSWKYIWGRGWWGEVGAGGEEGDKWSKIIYIFLAHNILI